MLAGLVQHPLAPAARRPGRSQALLLPGAVLAPVAGGELHRRPVGQRHRDPGDPLAAAGPAGGAGAGAGLGQGAEGDGRDGRGARHGVNLRFAGSGAVHHSFGSIPELHRQSSGVSGTNTGGIAANRTGVVSGSRRVPRAPGCAAPAGARGAPVSTACGSRGGAGPGGLADRVGERLEVVAVRTERVGVGASRSDLPAARGGQPLRVGHAQVVAVRLGVGRERAEDRRRVGVDVGERGDGRAAAGGARTAADRAHGANRTQDGDAGPPTRPPGGDGLGPARCGDGPRLGRWLTGLSTRRDRRAGTGAAGACAGRWLPRDLPLTLTRAEQFDELVLTAVTRLERRWADELRGRRVRRRGRAPVPSPTRCRWAAARSATLDRPARLVVYRRPVEARARSRGAREDLVHAVVVEPARRAARAGPGNRRPGARRPGGPDGPGGPGGRGGSGDDALIGAGARRHPPLRSPVERSGTTLGTATT